MTYGYKYVRAGEGNLITMSQIVYNAFAGAVVFQEKITAWTLLGGALILGAAVWLTSGLRDPRAEFGTAQDSPSAAP